MSEQPTREDLIRRLRFQVQKMDEFNSKIMNGGSPSEPNPFLAMELCGEAAEYLASLDAPASVPQEWVSEEMLDRAIEGYWSNATENTHRTALRRALQAAIAPLLDENARLKTRIAEWEKTADHHWSARQKLQRELNVVTELYNAGRGAEARVAVLEGRLKELGE